MQQTFDDLIEFVESKGYKVQITSETNGDFFYPSSKRIVIEKRDEKTMLFYLLHEIGHMLLHIDKEEWRDQNLKYTLDDDVEDDIDFNKVWYQCANLSEEHKAWSLGKKLIHDFEIDINMKEYEAEWADAIKDYIFHAYRILSNNQDNTPV